MNAQELFQAGKLDEAVQALGAELRDNPTDAKRRTFLFELLCFAGDYERAEKQLDVLASDGRAAEMGALLYRAALHAERIRQAIFEKQDYPLTGPESDAPLSGTIERQAVSSLSPTPIPASARGWRSLRPATICGFPCSTSHRSKCRLPRACAICYGFPRSCAPAPAFKGKELGEVLLPVLSPLSWKHADDQVRLGHATDWQDDGAGNVVPVGQKMFAADEDEVPILEIRKLEFAAAQAAP